MSGIFTHVFHQRCGNSTVSLEVPGRVQQIHRTFASDSVQWCSVGDPSMVQWCSVHRMYPGNKRLMAIWDNVGTTPMMGLVQIGDWWTILYLLEPDGHEWDVRYARSRYGTCLFTNLELVWAFWYWKLSLSLFHIRRHQIHCIQRHSTAKRFGLDHVEKLSPKLPSQQLPFAIHQIFCCYRYSMLNFPWKDKHFQFTCRA